MDLNQTSLLDFSANLRYGLDIDIEIDTPAGKQAATVQMLQGDTLLRGSTNQGVQSYVGGNSVYHLHEIFPALWHSNLEQIQTALMDVSTPDVLKARQSLKDLWQSEFFNSQRSMMERALLAELATVETEFWEAQSDLTALIAIGLNEDLASVRRFKRSTDSALSNGSPYALIRRAVRFSEPLNELIGKLKNTSQITSAALEKLAKSTDLAPAVDVFARPRKQLALLYWLRATPQ